MLGKKLINSGPISSGANTFASENFNTVLYTGNGSSQRIGGYINRGAVFNGSNSTITIPNSSVFDFKTATSMSFFVNRNTTSRQFIIDKANGGSGSYGWQLEYFGTTKGYQFQIHNTANGVISNLETGANSTTKNWEHIVVTHNGSGEFKIYFNGVLKATQTLSGTVSTNTGAVKIGTYQLASGLEFNGKLDQLRFFNKLLSQSEIDTLYAETFASTTISTTDIFSDNSGVALYQLDGNANDTGGVSGKYGAAAHFNGSNSFIKLPNNLINNVSPQNFSVAFWFNNENLSKYAATFSPYAWESGVNYGWALYGGYGTGKIRLISYSSNGNIDLSGATSLSANTWYHCTLTYDGAYSTVKLYLNGSQDASDSTPGNRTYISSHTYYVGAQNNGAGGVEGHFQGKIDDIRVYTDVLTATEVGYIYNNTTASIPTDNLLAHYKLNGDARDEQQLYDGAATNVTYAYDGTASNITYQEATKFTPDLVWMKSRTQANSNHVIYDSIRTAGEYILPNTTGAEGTITTGLTSFDSTGFTVGSEVGHNNSGSNYVAWCFNAGSGSSASNTDGSITSTVKANTAAGFSIVSYTANGTAGTTIGHGLSEAPQLIIVKHRNGTSNWPVYATGLSAVSKYLYLNTSGGETSSSNPDEFHSTAPTSSVFSIGVSGNTNTNNGNYIAYCFHDVVGYQKIGSYAGGTTNKIIETGFEPAFLLIKAASGTNASEHWIIYDNKRSPSNPRNDWLYPNLSNAENVDVTAHINFLSNGFQLAVTSANTGINGASTTYIYLAIAADPDTTTPTVENSFDVVTYTGNGATNQDIETDFKPDLIWVKSRSTAKGHIISDSVRVDGTLNSLPLISSNLTDAESSGTDAGGNYIRTINSSGFSVGNSLFTGANGTDYVAWVWKAGDHDDNLPQINTEGTIDSTVSVNDAAGFSIVKYTSTGTNGSTIGHGLSSAPNLIIIKSTSNTSNWIVYASPLGTSKYLYLNGSGSAQSASWINTSATTFTLNNTYQDANTNGRTYIAYCWYSVTGHSKIGSYVGTGGSISAIDVGFEPRFVMIKSTGNTSGSWAILDNLREGTSKHQLSANGSHAEYDNQGVTFTSTGFSPRQSLSSDTNTSSVTYIYIAFK